MDEKRHRCDAPQVWYDIRRHAGKAWERLTFFITFFFSFPLPPFLLLASNFLILLTCIKAMCLLNVYSDGSVIVSHTGSEMGQGIHTKVAQVPPTLEMCHHYLIYREIIFKKEQNYQLFLLLLFLYCHIITN